MSIGKQKAFISVERLMSLVNLALLERSSVAYVVGERVSGAADIFNNLIDTDQSIDDAETSLVGRIT